MTIDLAAIPAAVREEQIRLGRHYSSSDTLAQANKTILAFGTHGAALAPGGFVPDDIARLTSARDMLVDAGVDRLDARGDKKTTSATFASAMKTGKKARLRARSVLQNVVAVVQEAGIAGADQDIEKAKATMSQTVTAGDDAEKLATQLDQLRAALALPLLAGQAAQRGGTEASAELASAATALRATSAAKATSLGTPQETERLDHIDGIIVGLVRRARAAARTAAKQLGSPAIATAFELEHLYAGTSRKKAATKDELPKGDGAVG